MIDNNNQKTDITSLPIDCLIAILRKCSLQRQLELRQVCSQWRDVIERQLCARRRSLKLFNSEKCIKKYCLQLICNNAREDECLKLRAVGNDDDDLILANADGAVFSLLLRLFPKLERLVVHLDVDTGYDHLPRYISQNEHLQSLSLCGANYQPAIDFIAPLSQAINSLTNLKHLHLLANNLFVSENGTTLPIELPQVLPQLEHLSLIEYDGDLCQLFQQLTAKCTHLRLDLIPNVTDKLTAAFQDNTPLHSSVTHLRISLGKLENAKELLMYICGHLKNLQFLDFQCFPLFNSGAILLDLEILENVNKLRQLRELRLSHIAIDTMRLHSFTLPQLPNIVTLHLSQVTTVPSQAGVPFIQTSIHPQCWQAIACIFPNLRKLHIRVKRNSIVDIEAHLKTYFGHLKHSQVYSVGDKVEEYFGRHLDCYWDFPQKSFRVFESDSEILFDFVKDL